MSSLLGRPTTKPPRPTKVKRLPAQDDDTESMVSGMILAAIIWPTLILLLWLATRHLGADAQEPAFKPVRKAAFDIELTPEEFTMPRKPEPPPQKFVEVNPDAPENIPDKTNNFGAQNQQVAQEKPTPDGKSDRPATEGKKDFENNQIVSGELTPPTAAPLPEPPPTPEIAQALQQAAAAQKAQNPLSGFEKREGESVEGFGANIAKPSDNATAVPDKVDGVKDAPIMVGNPFPSPPQINPHKPQERARLPAQRVRPAILADNKFGTQNIGPVAFDARWSNYGAYLQRLIDSVQIQWERLIVQSNVVPPTGTIVTVKFRLNQEGNISEIINVESNGGQQASSICKSSITSRAPYGKWTDDMVAMMGDSQELTFSFYYN